MAECDFEEKQRVISMIANSWIRSEYYRIKAILDEKIPTRMDLFKMMNVPQYLSCIEKSKENIFKQYLDALEEMGELDAEELAFKNDIGGEFLHVLETTLMQKTYKMVILKAFYNNGNIKMALTEKDILDVWKDFFAAGDNWKDLGVESYQEFLGITDEQHLTNARKNPIKHLLLSGQGFFVERTGYEIALAEELKDVVESDILIKHFGDIIEYRISEYFRKKNF